MPVVVSRVGVFATLPFRAAFVLDSCDGRTAGKELEVWGLKMSSPQGPKIQNASQAPNARPSYWPFDSTLLDTICFGLVATTVTNVGGILVCEAFMVSELEHVKENWDVARNPF